jgi:hypothetical protein
MLDIYLIYQLARRPLHAMARSWICRGLAQLARADASCRDRR